MQWLRRFWFKREKASHQSVAPKQRQASTGRQTDRRRKPRRRRPSGSVTRLQEHGPLLEQTVSERLPSKYFLERPNRKEPILVPRRPKQNLIPTLPKLLVYPLRLSIIGIGLGAISGTLLSALEKTSISLSAEANSSKQTVQDVATVTVRPPALPLKQESSELKARVQELMARSPQLQAGVLLADLDTGIYVIIEGTTPFAAASTIKLPLLVAFFQAIDAGKITPDEMLTMDEELIASEAGTMQYKQPGTQFSALETATQMITISDNTATNMILKRLGGAEALNQRFRQWGLEATSIRNLLPDVKGTNTTSPMDLGQLIAKVNRGDLVSRESRDRLLEILRHVVTNDLLPSGLDQEAKIAHKTGNIGSLLADAGLVETPIGKRYIAVVMVKRPYNDLQAKQLIRDISRAAYQYFNQPTSAPPVSPTPNVTTTPAATSGSVATEAHQ